MRAALRGKLELRVSDEQGKPLKDARVATWPNVRYGEWSATILGDDCSLLREGAARGRSVLLRECRVLRAVDLPLWVPSRTLRGFLRRCGEIFSGGFLGVLDGASDGYVIDKPRTLAKGVRA